jgi:hypothetical protein
MTGYERPEAAGASGATAETPGQPATPHVEIKSGFAPPMSYFAGFFDGEGYIGIDRGRGTRFYVLKCEATNIDLNVLALLKQQFGGKILLDCRKGVNRRPVGRWTVESKSAEAFLRAVVPFLIVKKERAELALCFRLLFTGENMIPRGSMRPDPERRKRILRDRESYYHAMRRLNQRGTTEYVCQPGRERR